MVRKTVTALILIIGAIWALATIHPATPATPISQVHTSTPSPTASMLPACTYEDGSGQALCTWDASKQGNGRGTDVIAGDCSVGTVGTDEASAACVRLWGQPTSVTTMADGSMSTIEDGKVLVWECLDIEWSAQIDNDIREQLNSDGWNLAECFKAHIE